MREVILATNFTNEGEATAHYLGELLAARDLRVTRLARGVPVGGELEYVDAGTLAQALRERRDRVASKDAFRNGSELFPGGRAIAQNVSRKTVPPTPSTSCPGTARSAATG